MRTALFVLLALGLLFTAPVVAADPVGGPVCGSTCDHVPVAGSVLDLIRSGPFCQPAC